MAKKKRTTRAKVDKKQLHKRAVRRPKAKSRGKAKPKAKPKAKKRVAKKPPARKRSAKKRVAKKAPAKKRSVKKRSVKKRSVKKRSVKKRSVKKRAVKKRVAKKAPAKKRSAKKAPAKKRSVKKAPAKKRSVKKAPAKKRVVKKAPAKKRSVKKAPAKKSTARPAPPPPAARVAKLGATSPPRRMAQPTATAAPPPPAQPTTSPQPLLGVRVGRLPPRTEAKAAPQPRPGFVSPHLGRLAVSPTLRRAEITQDTWKQVDALARDLGLPGLRSEQRRAIRSALEGKDTLVALPSGFGKSACYQLPAQLFPQPVVVVSPRAALGREHHDRLLHRRVPAVRIDGAVQNGHKKSALARIAQGGPLVVFTTPDILATSELSEALARTGISLLVVDDAHTVSEWSDELCAASTLLGSLIARLGSPPLMALLGAAPPAVRHDVVDALGMRSPTVVDDLAVRENIVLETVEARGEVRQRALVQLVMRLRRPGIIYASTPREVDAIHAALGAARVPVHRYHAELPAGERVGEQLNFMLPGRRTVMVATSAFAPHVGLVGLGDAEHLDRAPEGFGLGLDKRDVRFVIHWGAPASLEQYAREIGAAGRDGELAHAVLLFEPGDSSKNAAVLARHRINAQHLAMFVRALESRALEASSTAVESLALESGLTRATADTLASALDAAGLVSYRAGWLTVQVPTLLLSEQARRLGAELATLRAQDDKRLEAVNRYVEGGECKRVALGRYFGAAGLARCGKCSACGEPSLITTSGSGAEAPHRREPARDFSVTRVDRYERFEHGYSSDRRQAQSLTAKLGDFNDVPIARVR